MGATAANAVNWSALTVSTAGLQAGQIQVVPTSALNYYGSSTFEYTLM
jgi:hypothetical protein